MNAHEKLHISESVSAIVITVLDRLQDLVNLGKVVLVHIDDKVVCEMPNDERDYGVCGNIAVLTTKADMSQYPNIDQTKNYRGTAYCLPCAKEEYLDGPNAL